MSYADGASVLFDEAGPGVITRIWSPNPVGRVQFYFDDEELPTWDVDFAEMLAGHTPIVQSPFAGEFAEGSASFLPVPFQHHLRIISDRGGVFYYQIEYRQFDEFVDTGRPTVGEGLEPCAAKQFRDAIAEPALAPRGDLTWTSGWISSADQNPIVVSSADGGGEIVSLVMVLDYPSTEVLAGTMLRILVDGEPSVLVPVARFFNFDPNGSRVESLPIRTDLTSGEVESRFVIPFSNEVRVSLVGEPSLQMRAAVRLGVSHRPPADSDFRFRAVWTGPILADSGTPQDVRLIEVNGSGKYVGTSLRVGNATAAWWGEGDEKIWVDDDSFPSRFGTGTEDYFGYGFCSTERFSTPWFGQFRANYSNFAGVIELYRFHMADAIPFQRNFAFDLEVLTWDAPFGVHNPVELDAVAYVYVEPGSTIETSWDGSFPRSGTTVPASMIEIEPRPYVTCR